MRHLRSAAAVLAASVVAVMVVGPPSPSYAGVPAACTDVQVTQPPTPSDPVTRASAPLTAMGIAQFQQQVMAQDDGRLPGHGIGVAVVDSGVVTSPGLPTAEQVHVDNALPAPAYYHGTAVAGLIVGRSDAPDRPIGIAPGAELFDVHFYDVETPGDTTSTDQGAPLSADTLAAALERVSAMVAAGRPIRIVNASVATSSSTRLKAAVDELTRQGVVIVASSGNRPTDTTEYPPGYTTPQYGEDAAGVVFPAGYAVDNPMVVAVGSTVEGEAAADPLGKLLASSAIDVVAPSAGGVSYALNGVSCQLPTDPYTSFSTAEVSGVLAALMPLFHDESSQEVVSRLEATATGRAPGPDVPADRYTGQGVVQPLEALTRHLDFDGSGRVVGPALPVESVEPVALPQPPPDVLRSTRHHALWWGLAGGGALLVAMMLRPVLARRPR